MRIANCELALRIANQFHWYCELGRQVQAGQAFPFSPDSFIALCIPFVFAADVDYWSDAAAALQPIDGQVPTVLLAIQLQLTIAIRNSQ